MTFEDNIARVRELLAQRDEIDTELEGLIGAGATPAKSPATRPEQKTGKKKGTKVCKNCGRPGHLAKTCKAVPAPAATTTFGDKQLMTEDQFDDLKHLQSVGDLISKEFAAENSLPLSEVNRAIGTRNYELYAHG
jgi:hypothetical protein